MGSVIPMRRRPVDCERALALIQEAQRLLVNLFDKGLIEEGSPPAETVFYLENAIGMLKLDDAEVGNG